MFVYFSTFQNQDIIGTETPHWKRSLVKVRQVGVGCDGLEGLIWSMGEPDFNRESQTWLKQSDSLYIGYDSFPHPADLKRDRPIDGHNVTLGDGNIWTIPVARMINGGTTLPQTLRLTEAGKVALELNERHKRLYDFACKFWALRMEAAEAGAPQIELTFEEIFAACAEIIGINYMISEREISIMGLVTTDNIKDIMDAIIDIPSLNLLIEASKKKQHSTGA